MKSEVYKRAPKATSRRAPSPRIHAEQPLISLIKVIKSLVIFLNLLNTQVNLRANRNSPSLK